MALPHGRCSRHGEGLRRGWQFGFTSCICDEGTFGGTLVNGRIFLSLVRFAGCDCSGRVQDIYRSVCVCETYG